MTTDQTAIGDAPIEHQYRDLMNGLAEGIDEILNGERRGKERKTGFVLLVFNFGDGPGRRANYISNAERDDVLDLLRQQIKRFEAQP